MYPSFSDASLQTDNDINTPLCIIKLLDDRERKKQPDSESPYKDWKQAQVDLSHTTHTHTHTHIPSLSLTVVHKGKSSRRVFQ